MLLCLPWFIVGVLCGMLLFAVLFAAGIVCDDEAAMIRLVRKFEMLNVRCLVLPGRSCVACWCLLFCKNCC